VRLRPLATAALAGLCATVVCACASTLQDQPIPHNILEGMVQAPFPVYWLGRSFQGMSIAEATHDPSDAFNIQYGNCLVGGEGGCVPPLRVVTSPDNSFLPVGSTPTRTTRIRGARALLADEGKTIVIPTAGVVVEVYDRSAPQALAAAQTLVPINAVGTPGSPLPAALPNTGFGETPLPSQLPAPLKPVG
jgi:hypothetical protein